MKFSQLQVLLTFSTVFFINTVSAGFFNPRSQGLQITKACTRSLTAVAKFCTTADTAKCVCKNIDYAGSYIYCILDHADNETAKKQSIAIVDKLCPAYGFDEAKFNAIYENATSYLVNTSTIAKFNKTKIISYPVYYSVPIYDTYYEVMQNFFNSYHLSFYYGGALTAFFPVIFLFGGILHWFSVFFPQKTSSIRGMLQKSKIVRLTQKHVTIPSLFNGSHAAPAPVTGGHYPTRLHSIFMGMWSFAWLILQCTDYRDHVPGNPYLPTKTEYLTRLIADRTGIIATFLIPLVFVLSGRNSLFIIWTGWKQSTFYAYHKLVARACVLGSLVHCIMYVVFTILDGSYTTYKVEAFWKWGIVAVIVSWVIFFQALPKLRTQHYEIFYAFHFILALFFLIGTWIHLKERSFNVYVYIVVGFWGLDRLLRCVRMLYFGVKTAKVTAVHDEVLRISIPRRKNWPVYPGAYGYVYFMRPNLFWQSHPFSIVGSEDGQHLNFYVKAKTGATGAMLEYAKSQKGNTAEVKVMFEGPYGSQHTLDHYDDLLFFSSGNGIPGVYPYLMNVLKTPQNQARTIKLYWIIQRMETVDWFKDELLALQNYSNVETIVYVTRDSPASSVDLPFKETAEKGESTVDEVTNSVDVSEQSSTETLTNVEFRYERPDVEELCRSELTNVGASDVAVVSCGHGAICDTLRRTVADISGIKTSGRLDYIEEFQAW
ncbi:unnamed protein product [Kluyveromyces dobzhanskii CBS 2104]|uniref:ferric-chelate reductase (NADPH) n=1 Tax=Kluyveromyces dobzhanskii CBS 2104 TaxID=1427455 RepID=A0A0A8L842_9SACH|nr:unnamed protein product [Kluyveromyces dobzhanskii CBS 2104]